MISLSFKSAEELKTIIGKRDVYLWGASIVGFGVARALERNSIKPKAFIDISMRLRGKIPLNYPIFLPEEILNDQHRTSIFIVITSGHYEHEIALECKKHDLIENRDFISARSLCPLDPSIDISGICNLHCISCPRGNIKKQPAAGFITLSKYEQILNKLLRELPFIGNLQLYAWGEPFLHPEIASIIRMTVEKNVLCALSTNLNISKDFTDAIKARPDWIKISVSGYGESYERTHSGGKWPLLVENMKKLSALRDLHNPSMYIEVNYHIYKHNSGSDLIQMRELSESLGFIFRANHAYLYSLDNVMAYREGKKLTAEALETLELLLLPIDEGIERAEQQKNLACAEERCFPINWNGAVRYCGAYFEPIIADNFLEMSLSDIVEKRNSDKFCNKCRSMALHRFTSIYLEETTPDTITRSKQ